MVSDGREQVSLQPISDTDVPVAAAFLHRNMDSSVSEGSWAAAMDPPWEGTQPNHGFMLLQGRTVVGVYLAFYSERVLEGAVERFCNLGAWCVLEEHRSYGFRLLRAFLKQKELHLTDFSPSGNVVDLNTRLGFVVIDNPTSLMPNLPGRRGRGSVHVTADTAEIDGVLEGEARRIHRDHARTTVNQAAIVTEQASCLVLFRRDRLKRLPLFATILYVSDPEIFHSATAQLGSYLLVKHGLLATMIELRVAGNQRPKGSKMIRPPRQRMYRSRSLDPEKIDYLYSELTCVAW